MNLAIKGHSTRSKEVLELLKMIGGKNFGYFSCDYPNKFYYVLDGYIRWDYIGPEEIKEYVIFTLEEFFEKYPYKIGDRVKTIYGKIGIVNKPIWSNRDNCIRYELKADIDSFYFINELQPYKEETMEDKPNLLQQLKDYFDNTPREVIEKEWHEYDKFNEIEPTVKEYLEYVNKIKEIK